MAVAKLPTGSTNNNNSSSSTAPNLSHILINYYKQPFYAELKRLLYDKTYPIKDNFINLALIKDVKQKDDDKRLREEAKKIDKKQELRNSCINLFADIPINAELICSVKTRGRHSHGTA